jgi:hypothetical protein
MEFCLFCDGSEKAYQPTTEFVCSGCVQLLCNADQGDLRRACAKAVKLKLERKAMALTMFIEKEEMNVRAENPKRKQRNLTKYHYRAGNRKTSGSHQRPARTITNELRVAVRENQQPVTPVF